MIDVQHGFMTETIRLLSRTFPADPCGKIIGKCPYCGRVISDEQVNFTKCGKKYLYLSV
jgi:hypothetical protein